MPTILLIPLPACVLGQWLYGEAGTDDAEVMSLRSQLEPLHRQLHSSATEALDLLSTSPFEAREYYQESILTNLGTLVGLLDQVVERGTALSEESSARLDRTAVIMHWTCAVCLVLALGCLISLVQYVLSQIVRPIIRIVGGLHVLLRTAGEIVQRGIHLLNGACLLRRALGQGLGAVGELLGIAGDAPLRIGDLPHGSGQILRQDRAAHHPHHGERPASSGGPSDPGH